MKAIVEETLVHPTLGNLIKKFVYTFDENLYASVELAIAAGNSFLSEQATRQLQFNQAVLDRQNNVITQEEFLIIRNDFILWQQNTSKGWTNKEPFIQQENDDVDTKQLITLNAMILNRAL